MSHDKDFIQKIKNDYEKKFGHIIKNDDGTNAKKKWRDPFAGCLPYIIGFSVFMAFANNYMDSCNRANARKQEIRDSLEFEEKYKARKAAEDSAFKANLHDTTALPLSSAKDTTYHLPALKP